MSGFILRAGRPRDARAMARILAAWIAETPWFESQAPDSASRAAMAGHLRDGQVLVARAAGFRRQVLGFGVRHGDELTALYVARAARRQGIGRAIFAALAAGRADLSLSSFAANQPARAFYAAMGCHVLRQTGGENEEGLPDLRLLYPAQTQRTAHG